MHRLDQFLDGVCLFKTRSAAAKAIDAGWVRVDGEVVKRSHQVAVGQVIEISEPRRSRVLEVLDVPGGPVSKRDAPRCLRVIRDEPLDVG